MKDFYQVIILTLKRFAIFNSNYLIINTPVFLLNSNEIKINEKIISFDYLIFDNIKLVTFYMITRFQLPIILMLLQLKIFFTQMIFFIL